MKTIIHKASSRGHADHGWLNTHHSFSFAHYYDPERMGFGMLRVLNDDIVQPGKGFGTHPHDNMEIVSIPVKGALEHKDSTGQTKVIRENDVQIMSAGTGVTHSEYNHSIEEPVNFLQIWIYPKEKNIEPHYEQKTFAPEDRRNQLKTIISPEKNDETLWINQDAWLLLGNFDAGKKSHYQLHQRSNGLYIFVLDGEVEISGEKLSKRDGMAIWEIHEVKIQVINEASFLLIETPMK